MRKNNPSSLLLMFCLIILFACIVEFTGCGKKENEIPQNEQVKELKSEDEKNLLESKEEYSEETGEDVAVEENTQIIMFRLHADTEHCVYYSSEEITSKKETITIKYSGIRNSMSFWLKQVDANVNQEDSFELKNDVVENISVVPGVSYQLIMDVPFERTEQEDVIIELTDVTIKRSVSAPVPTFFDEEGNITDPQIDIETLSGGYSASKESLESISSEVANVEDVSLNIENALMFISTRLENMDDMSLESELNRTLSDIQVELNNIGIAITPEAYASLIRQYSKQRDLIGNFVSTDTIKIIKDEKGVIVLSEMKVEFANKEMNFKCTIEDNGMISYIELVETE